MGAIVQVIDVPVFAFVLIYCLGIPPWRHYELWAPSCK